MTGPHPPPFATIAIIAIGQMGAGIASLLLAHNYRVVTNVSDRSTATQQRARDTGIELLSTDDALIVAADYVLSIVPPKDAVATAKRIEDAWLRVFGFEGVDGDGDGRASRGKELYYLDLNAISPKTTNAIAASFASNTPSILYVDGGIIGGPPKPNESESEGTEERRKPTIVADQIEDDADASPGSTWTRPGIPLSGPLSLPTRHLARTLNSTHISSTIGSASGLKCCFAALSKGFTALALQSYTSADALGVLPNLQSYLDAYSPEARVKAEKGITGCTSKAGRWVEEMRQIGECFDVEGGFGGGASVFREVAGVFDGLADAMEGAKKEDTASAESVVKALGRDLKRKRGDGDGEGRKERKL